VKNEHFQSDKSEYLVHSLGQVQERGRQLARFHTVRTPLEQFDDLLRLEAPEAIGGTTWAKRTKGLKRVTVRDAELVGGAKHHDGSGSIELLGLHRTRFHERGREALI
jgi:hypothetical protein